MAIINNSISDHLNYLEETKEQIKQALSDKGQIVNNIPFRNYVDSINNLGTAQVYNNLDEMNNTTMSIKNGSVGIVYDIDNSNFQGLYYYNKNKYEPAKTQFKAVDEDVMEVPYYGKNGVSVGNLNSIKYINNSNVTDIHNYYNKFYNLFDKIDTSNVTRYICHNFNLPYYKVTNLNNCNDLTTAFINSRNLEIIQGLDNRNLETSNITSLQQTFQDCHNLRYLNLANSDLSNVTTTQWMFKNCHNLVSINFCNTNMVNLVNTFAMCEDLRHSLVNIDINKTNWQPENLALTFKDCSNLKYINSFSYNSNLFKNATNLYRTFEDCINLVGGVYIYNTSKIQNIAFMINHANLHLNLNLCDFTNCTSMEGIAGGYGNLYINNCIIPMNLIYNAFKQGNSATINLNNCTFIQENSHNLSNLFRGCKYSNNIKILPAATKENTIKNITNAYAMFRECNNLKSIYLPLFDFSNCLDYSYMFYNDINLHDINLHINSNYIKDYNIQMASVENTSQMFYNCSNLTAIGFPDYFENLLNTGTLKDCSSMFFRCNNLNAFKISAGGDVYLPWTSWNLSSCENTSRMFAYCKNLNSRGLWGDVWSDILYINEVNLGKCLNSSEMFADCSNMVINYLSFTNTYSIQNTAGMFRGTYTIINNNTLHFNNYSNSTNIDNMFCTTKRSNYMINNNFYGSFNWVNCNLINMQDMSQFLYGAEWIDSLNIINVSIPITAKCSRPFVSSKISNVYFENFNIPNLNTIQIVNIKNLTIKNSYFPKVPISMIFQGPAYDALSCILDNCTLNTENMYNFLYSAENITNLVMTNMTIKPTNCYRAFCYCGELSSFNLSSFNFNFCNNINQLFYQCRNLKSLEGCETFNLGNCSNLVDVFYGCQDLQNINISNWYVLNIIRVNNLFYNCKNLTNNSIDSIINMCLNLNSLDNNYKNIYNSIFVKCNITNDRFQNRWEELTAAGWTY